MITERMEYINNLPPLTKYSRTARRFIMGCLCNFFENDSFIWIIVIILLLLILNCTCCG